ncbi:MAG TPA: hypothetical protein VFX59_08380 [Polyangiales bacterium]|nr:hypothetical protein [Polyangiales bacterium]
MSLLWLLTALLGGDPCSPFVEPPKVAVDARSMEISISRTFGIPWTVCAQEKGGKAPVLRVTAKDGAGNHVLLEKPVELGESLRDATRSFSATASGCDGTVPNRRDANALLQGPVGSRHWYNRRSIEIELSAEGPFSPLAFKTQTEVFCRACDDGDTASISYYQNDFDKNTVRLVVSLDKARFECAKGGGRMTLRRFWAEPDAEPWAPLRPYEVTDNLQDRLKPNGESMMYELIEPAARFCKAGKSQLFELIGIDEYATIMRHHYGPSDAIHRSGIEFLRCKE